MTNTWEKKIMGESSLFSIFNFIILDRVLYFFTQGWLQTVILLPTVSCIAGTTDVYHYAWGLTNFLPRLALNYDPK
jgi:hypothetical protein